MAGHYLPSTPNNQSSVLLENTFVRGAESVYRGGWRIAPLAPWMRIDRYSSHTDGAANLLNGILSTGEITQLTSMAAAPDYVAIRSKHYARGPSFEDRDVVNVRDFDAKGDGATDDTAAFVKAITARDKVLVPKGDYLLSGTLRVRPNTHLFGLSRTFTSLGGRGRCPSHPRLPHY